MVNNLEWITDVRRDLHRIPEIAFDLPKTSLYIRNCLISLGYAPIQTAKSGWIAVKEGASREAIAFRSDMDALSVDEQTNAAFASSIEGHMHACGHDGHMSMLLGFAKEIAKMDLQKTIVLIFQPAEEGPGGAKLIIDEGLLDAYPIHAIFAIHLDPLLNEGKFGIVDGPMMAANGEFDLTIQGRSSHGAQPHLGQDAILASSALIQAYHTIVSRDIDPLSPGVVTIGTINGGEARNIIPQTVKLTGTFRSFETELYDKIKQRMRQIDQGISIAYNVKVDNDIQDHYPPVNNDVKLAELARKVLGPDAVLPKKPLMFAEDFAFYQQRYPGLMVMLGTRNEELGYIHPLHSCYFNFREETLLQGVDYYLSMAETLGALTLERSE
ncbi:MAG: M20 family metallopeptidase [Erysipelotrichaceae bacterium]